jgi:hypothetical protein
VNMEETMGARSAQQVFADADVDSSGFLDRDEMEKQFPDVGKDFIDGLWMAFDVNQDGRIDEKEWPALYEIIKNRNAALYEALENGDASVFNVNTEEAGAGVVVRRAERDCSRGKLTVIFTVLIFILVATAAVIMYAATQQQEVLEKKAAAPPCAKSPCENQAPCTDLAAGGFRCTCYSGFGGETCETNSNECASTPCKNGGSCAQATIADPETFSGDFYTCSCPAGFEGEICQVDIDECEANPCEHGGVCMQTGPTNGGTVPGDFTCSCADGYTGPRCETFSPATRVLQVMIPCEDTSCIKGTPGQAARTRLPAEILGNISDSLNITLDVKVQIENVQIEPKTERVKDTISFELHTLTVARQQELVVAMTSGAQLPAGWAVDDDGFGTCDYMQSGEASTQRSSYPGSTCPDSGCAGRDGTDALVECIQAYGTLLTASDPDVYILEDVSSSFEDDLEQLSVEAGFLSQVMEQMFDDYRIGIGSFSDVGDFCFRTDQTVTSKLPSATITEKMNTIASLPHPTPPAGTPNQKLYQMPCENALTDDGEASLPALRQVGLQHEALGFTSATLRVVLLSTDDYFKLGDPASTQALPGIPLGCADGDCRFEAWNGALARAIKAVNSGAGSTADAGGYDTGCMIDKVDPGVGSALFTAAGVDYIDTPGANQFCERIPSAAEVKVALADAEITPLFFIAPSQKVQGANGDENEGLTQAYKALVGELGGDPEKHVMPLSDNSDNFVELTVLGLRRLIGDLPPQCERGDGCAQLAAELAGETPPRDISQICPGCAPLQAQH